MSKAPRCSCAASARSKLRSRRRRRSGRGPARRGVARRASPAPAGFTGVEAVIGARGGLLPTRPPPLERSCRRASSPTHACSQRPARALPAARVLAIGTTARVGGSSGVRDRGDGGLRAFSAPAGSPACLRSRCGSSSTRWTSPDRTRWRFDDGACAARCELAPRCWRRSMPELPAALPPAERTVGQLIAETIRAYGEQLLAGATPRAPGRGVDPAVARAFRERPDGRPLRVRTADRGVVRWRLSPRARYAADAQGLPAGGADLRAGAVSRPRHRAARSRVARAHRAGGTRIARREPRLPARPRTWTPARHRRLRARPRLTGRGRDRCRCLRADPDRAASLAGPERAAGRPRARRSRPDAAALPRRRPAVCRSGGQDRLPPTRSKEPSRCRSSSCSRR